MNFLANLNGAVVDVQGDSTSWPSDEGWEPSVATICTGNSLTDSRLQLHHAGAHAAPHQEWGWCDNSLTRLATQFSHENLDSKPSTLQLEEALVGGGPAGAGERNFGAGFQSAGSMSPSLGGGAVAQSSWPWPGLLSAVPLRAPQMGLQRSGGSFYSPQSFLYGGEGLGLGGVAGSGRGLSSYYTQSSPLLGMATDLRRLHDVVERGTSTYPAWSDGGAPDFKSIRLGLDLGGRTYFSANESNLVARFHATGKRFRPNSPSLHHVPLCQVEGCPTDLSMSKYYYRRYKVCEYHSKASTVFITGGNTQRFCQQCSRFHALTEFDEGRRSCRKRLADHNRRRRKPQISPSATHCSNPGTSSELQPTLDMDDPDPEENEELDTKAGAATHHTTKGHSDQQEEAEVSKVEAMATSTSSTELAAAKPSVSFTLQDAGSREVMPFLPNGPSLSLSSDGISPAAGIAPGIHMASDSPPPCHHPPPLHTSHSFNEVELSVPWLKPHHAGPSSRINLMQKTLAQMVKASRPPGPEDGPLRYSSRRDMENAQFLNEHGHIFAHHMKATGGDHHHYHPHHQGLKSAENWMLETAGAGQQDQGQIVLNLLETAAGSKKEHDYSKHQRANLTMNSPEQASGHGDQRHPLGLILQQQHHHHSGAAGELNLSSASRSKHMEHEASDAALSLQCVQDLRPLNESLYTTADFMKDGFV